VLQRADHVHVGVRNHERPAEPAVHHPGGLGVTEGEVGAQCPFEQLHDPVIAAAGPEPEPGDVHVGGGLLGRRRGPAQQGEPGLGQPYGHVEAEAGRRQVRRAVHQGRRFGRVGSRSGRQGVAGRGDHVRGGVTGAQDRVDRPVVQALAKGHRDLGVHGLPHQLVRERIAPGP